MTTTPSVPPGLKGVAVTDTTIGDVRGEQGFYHYRQYSAVELAEQRTFEDVWQLLLDGDLPTSESERAAFAAETVAARALPAPLVEMLAEVARSAATGGGLDGLRSALSLYGSILGLQPVWDIDATKRRHDLLRLAAAAPVVVAALYRLGQGLSVIEPDPNLGHVANYLWMLQGVHPEPEQARALEQYLILTVDHGFNSSTFTARVIASTGADVAAAIVGAIGALSGPLHGGAPSRALDTLDAIGRLDRAETYVRDLLNRGERVMGFGHAVYRTHDPRSEMLKAVATRLGGSLAELAVEVEAIVLRLLAETRPDRPLYTNVEYYAGVVMDRCGLPRQMFTPTFAVSRVVGWCANIAEQADERRLIRPAARYVGQEPPVPVPPVAGRSAA
ncbi:MAG TPA: citrate synthase [Acidimicrobiales bacterium]|jgi:citrate synthase|nr:citrate synthase [Acidimicrobiales bacterium]